MQNELYESLDKLLAAQDLPAKIRATGRSGCAADLVAPLVESGFLDVMVSEEAGGAGLGWAQAWEVLFAAGRHGLPVPMGTTVFARALLANLGQTLPDGAITASGFAQLNADGALVARDLPSSKLSTYALLQHQDTVYLLPLSQAQITDVGGPGCFDGQATWAPTVVNQSAIGTAPRAMVAHGVALALAVQMAGVAARVLELTLTYANDRVQFGKPIGKFQALQQQISEMAELVYGARMASQIGCQTEQWQPEFEAARVAKTQTSAVAPRIAAIAHAVHAAIGVTYEYDLQLYTRRLYEWARLGGGEGYWAQQIGLTALSEPNLLDFVRQRVFQEA
ncbi:acyl-CoA dehydrogenase family protein [Orrella daihaiensis]|uniref:Acyl-CoA dehydrogenase n=1 Tax=Orrella daihaiensis TaxID=2782176 RepID=A0ABY4AMF0_9BURK|nr:acyl-CoA dehydrogenase family protein [Orrella daihaiensis]UOD51218.1 acyl-CoA dehydrogenase [Orrella daihaiensis]